MHILAFKKGALAFSLLFFLIFYLTPVVGQIQEFEKDFEIRNHPELFLPGWSANEVRNTASRVFQSNTEGLEGSRALGIQVISTFNAEIFVSMATADLENPKIGFFAKTTKNGSGTRPVYVFFSFAEENDPHFQFRKQIGNDQTFQNEDSEYQFFEVQIPDEMQGKEKLALKIEVQYGIGSGSAARLFIDDFAVFVHQFPKHGIQIKDARLINPYAVTLILDKEIKLPDIQHVKIGGKQVDSLRFPTDTTLVLISGEPLMGQKVQLKIEKIESKSGISTENLNYEISNEKILLGEVRVIQSDQIRLSFSQFFNPAQASQSGNFRINGKSPKELTVSENNFEINLNTADDLLLGEFFEVEITEIQSQAGEKNQNLKTSILYQDYLEEVFVKDANTISLLHSIPIEFQSIRAEYFEIIDHEFDFVASPISNNTGGIHLILNKSLEENIAYLLKIPDRQSDRGLWIPGSKRNLLLDLTPPELVSVIGISHRELLLIFSEPIDPAFAMMTENYILADIPIEKAVPQENPHQVLLSLSKELIDGETYKLIVNQIPDLSGNFINSFPFTFIFEDPAKLEYRSLIINELMAAPKAGNTLPNVEYLELLNISEKTIPLGGLSVSNSRSSTTLPPDILKPGEFVILAPRTQIHQFTAYGKVLGLTNWPNLLNAGDQVKLKDRKGNLLDSLHYTSANYGSTALASGGYSLEIVNPYFPCNTSSNLKPSISPARGTPGKINSVFDDSPDRTAPTLLQATVMGDTAVSLLFSKILHPNLESVLWIINPNLSIKNVVLGKNLNAVVLVFHEKIKSGISYQLEVQKLRDCTGNLIRPDQNKADFVIPSPAVDGDITLNELLFNPLSGSPKFVEIYNSSDKFINLKDWKLANLDNNGEVANRRIIFVEDFILEPFSYFVFTTDAVKLKSDYPKGKENRFKEMSGFPSYPIAGGNVVLLSAEENIKEIFSYSEKMHHVLLKEKRGVSLERLSAKTPADHPDNWHSASASAGFATPGYQNSQFYIHKNKIGIQINPKVFVPDAAGEQNFTTISYHTDQPGIVATVRIYAIDGQLIRELAQNEIWGNQGFYTWDGTNDAGRKVRPGYYIIWVEMFDLKGNVDQIKKTVVVGTKF